MKRAARLVLFACPLKRDARVDNFDNIDPPKKVIYEGLGDSSGHRLILARKESTVSQKADQMIRGCRVMDQIIH